MKSKLSIAIDQLTESISSEINFVNENNKNFFIENIVNILIDSDEDSLEENIHNFISTHYTNSDELTEGVLKSIGNFVRGVRKGIGRALGFGKPAETIAFGAPPATTIIQNRSDDKSDSPRPTPPPPPPPVPSDTPTPVSPKPPKPKPVSPKPPKPKPVPVSPTSPSGTNTNTNTNTNNISVNLSFDPRQPHTPQLTPTPSPSPEPSPNPEPVSKDSDGGRCIAGVCPTSKRHFVATTSKPINPSDPKSMGDVRIRYLESGKGGESPAGRKMSKDDASVIQSAISSGSFKDVSDTEEGKALLKSHSDNLGGSTGSRSKASRTQETAKNVAGALRTGGYKDKKVFHGSGKGSSVTGQTSRKFEVSSTNPYSVFFDRNGYFGQNI